MSVWSVEDYPQLPCAHHWILESPHGEPDVMGTCKLCHVSKPFPINAAVTADYAVGPAASRERREMSEILFEAERAMFDPSASGYKTRTLAFG